MKTSVLPTFRVPNRSRSQCDSVLLALRISLPTAAPDMRFA